MGKFFAIVGALALIQVVSSESNCDDNSKLQYEAGKSYVYNLELVAYDNQKRSWEDIQQNGASRRRYGSRTAGKITTNGKVVLTALENCQFALTLQNVTSQLHGIRATNTNFEGNAEGRQLPRTSMLFTFKNGEVSDLYKKEDESSVWTENIIRGLLTMIQNKGLSNAEGDQEEKETNIRGQCISRVFIPSDGLYSKTIAHNRCSEPVVTPSAGVPYFSPTYPVQIPHMRYSRGHMKCDNNVTNNLIGSSSCLEFNEIGVHAFHVVQEMTASLVLDQAHKEIEEVSGATTEEISTLSQKASIVYEEGQTISDDSWANNVNEGIVKLTKIMYTDKDVNKAELFQKLKERLMFVNNFETLEDELKNSFYEAPLQLQFSVNMVRHIAAEIGTESAIKYLSNLIHEEALGSDETSIFYNKLHLAKDATFEGLKALDVLVQDSLNDFMNSSILETVNIFNTHSKKRMYRMQILGVSAYAYQFCRQNPNCGTLPEYQELIHRIAQFSTSTQPDLSPAALQAVGNVGYLPEPVVKIISDILEAGVGIIPGTTAKMLAAFDAFRRDPCQPSLKKISRNIMSDKEYTRPFRLSAYLAVARCFDQEDLKAVEEIFNSEPTSYLSSFIASHYHNIMDSQSPSKAAQKSAEHFSQINVPNSVPSVHKNPSATQFVEYSTFRPDYNLGFSAEAASFFAESGGYPDMVKVNFTVDVFGKSYNKLEIGLSRELIPSIGETSVGSTMNFFSTKYNSAWVDTYAYFLSGDTYYRVFGTTVSMGIDVMESLKIHKFIDNAEDDETGAMRFDIVKAMTLVNHEIKKPTISGLPLSCSMQMDYIPMFTANHTGNENSEGFFDLISKWDEMVGGVFAHNKTSDRSIVAAADIAIGKGTPIHMGYHAVAKAHFNHSIGYESVKQENGWIKTIVFPEQVVVSARVTAVPEFFMELNGNELQKWPMFGEANSMEPQELRAFSLMGLKASVQSLSSSSFDAIVKIEKTEEEFKGYGLAIEMDDEGETARKIDLKAKAYGLSTGDTLHVAINYNDTGVFDVDSYDDKPFLKLSVQADHSRVGVQPSGLNFEYLSTGYQKSILAENPKFSELYSVGVLHMPRLSMFSRPHYSLQLRGIDNGETSPIFDWTINNNKTDATVSMKFNGILRALGDVNANLKVNSEGPKTRLGLKHPFHCLEDKSVNAEISQKSEDLGTNRFAVDYSFDSGEIWLNTTTEVLGVTHDVSHHLVPSFQHEKYEEGNTKMIAHKINFITEYKDSQDKKATMNVELNKVHNYLENEQSTVHRNITVQITSTDMQEPLLLEGTFQHEWDDKYETVYHGLKRRTANLYLNAFGKKQAEITWDQEHQDTGVDHLEECPVGRLVYAPRTGKDLLCSTIKCTFGLVVADHIEYLSTFSNERRIGLTKTIKAYYAPSESKFNLTFDHEYPTERNSNGVESKLVMLLKNADKTGWDLVSESDLDKENRTLEWSTVLKKMETDGNSMVLSKSNGKAHLAENFWNGESSLKIHNECAREGTTDVDVINKASTTGHWDTGLFTNNLLVLINHQGRTKILLPQKQFTWTYSSDGQIDEKEKTIYDFLRKIKSDVKYELLANQMTQEVFHYTNEFEFVKRHDKEGWMIQKGHYSVFISGEEKAEGNYEVILDIIPEERNEQQPKENEISQNALAETEVEETKSPMKIKLSLNMNGWFGIDFPSKQNVTHALFYGTVVIPSQRKVIQQTDFKLVKTDVADGKETFTLSFDGKKETRFKDLLHFCIDEDVTVHVDNTTVTIAKKIKINGPNVFIYMKSDDGSKAGSWLIDIEGGIKEGNHQHKLNFMSKTGSLAQLERVTDYNNEELNQLQHHHNYRRHHLDFHRYASYSLIPYTNFNITVSR